MKNEKGFTPVHIILVIFVIGIVGGASLYVWQNNQDKEQSSVSTSSESSKIEASVSDAFSNPEGIYIPDDSSIESVETRAIEETIDSEQPKDPNQLITFGESEYEEYFGFKVSYPETWNAQTCENEHYDGSATYSLWMNPDDSKLPGCDDWENVLEARIKFMQYDYEGYDIESEREVDRTYHKSHVSEYVEVNGKQVLRLETVWKGESSIIPNDTKTVDYIYAEKDGKNSKIWLAQYWQQPGESDNLSEFEKAVKENWTF